MSNETSLDGKAAVVTGAGAGLGRSEALALARQGANVVVNDIGEKADEVVAEIKALGRDAIAVKGDVSDWKLAEDLVNAAVDTWGSLDILVNNAGVLRDTVLFNMTEQMWDDVIRVHLKGHAATSTHAAKYWRAKGKAAGDQKIFGRVINTSSEAGLFGSGGQPNYSAAKAGITALTLSTSQALAKYGVTANVIAPRARTEMTVVQHTDGVIFPLGDENNSAIGAIYVSGIDTDEGIKLLQIYARQAASSINNAFLHSLVNTKNEELSNTYAQLKVRYMDTIEVLRLAVDAKDEYTRGHSDRVSYYATKIGRRMGLPPEELEKLRIAGVFHDIGKIGTADDILLKSETLSPEEYEEVKRHPIKGAMILSAVSMFADIVPIVRHHHEYMDGRGYPDGIRGEQIEPLARIISVADAFDAMMSDRHYRRHLSLEETRQQLIQGRGTQFDPQVVDVLLDALDNDEELQAMLASTVPADAFAKVVGQL